MFKEWKPLLVVLANVGSLKQTRWGNIMNIEFLIGTKTNYRKFIMDHAKRDFAWQRGERVRAKSDFRDKKGEGSRLLKISMTSIIRAPNLLCVAVFQLFLANKSINDIISYLTINEPAFRAAGSTGLSNNPGWSTETALSVGSLTTAVKLNIYRPQPSLYIAVLGRGCFAFSLSSL